MYDCIFDIEMIVHPLWHSHYVLTNTLCALESCPPDPDPPKGTVKQAFFFYYFVFILDGQKKKYKEFI